MKKYVIALLNDDLSSGPEFIVEADDYEIIQSVMLRAQQLAQQETGQAQPNFKLVDVLLEQDQ